MKASSSAAFDGWEPEYMPRLSAEVHSKLSSSSSFSQEKICYRRGVSCKDLDEVRELHKEWFPVSYNEDFFNSVVDGRLLSVVASLDDDSGSIVGLCLISLKKSEAQYNPSGDLLVSLGYVDPVNDTIAYILTLGVVDELRKLGIASKLLEKSIEEIRFADPNCRVVFLHVIEYNTPAKKLYEKNGFRGFKFEPNFYCIGEQLYGGILYYKEMNAREGSIRKLTEWIRRKINQVWSKLFTVKRFRNCESYNSDLETA